MLSVDSAWQMLAALGAGTGAVFMLRWFWWRINAWSEIAAMFSSLFYFLIINGLWAENLKKEIEGLKTEEVMAIVAALTIATWLIATFVTPPEDESLLRHFYQKIRPGGPGWKPIAKLEPETRSDGVLGLSIFCAFLAAGIVYAVLPAIGYVIFGETLRSGICVAFAGLFAIGLLILLPKVVRGSP